MSETKEIKLNIKKKEEKVTISPLVKKVTHERLKLLSKWNKISMNKTLDFIVEEIFNLYKEDKEDKVS